MLPFWSFALLESSLSHWHRHLAISYVTAHMQADERWVWAGTATASCFRQPGQASYRRLEMAGACFTKTLCGWLALWAGLARTAAWLLRWPMLLHSCGIATLCFGAACPLLSLFRVHRRLVFVASYGLHRAIAAVQSLGIDVAFCAPHVAIYRRLRLASRSLEACALASMSVARFLIFGVSPLATFQSRLSRYSHRRVSSEGSFISAS